MPGASCRILQLRIQADVFSLTVLVEQKGIPAQVYRRGLIDLQEFLQTAAVVIVTVGQHRKVHRSQIDIQLFGILGKGIGLPGIKEDPVHSRFNIKAQAVLADKLRAAGSIFDQCYNAHRLPFLRFHTVLFLFTLRFCSFYHVIPALSSNFPIEKSIARATLHKEVLPQGDAFFDFSCEGY